MTRSRASTSSSRKPRSSDRPALSALRRRLERMGAPWSAFLLWGPAPRSRFQALRQVSQERAEERDTFADRSSRTVDNDVFAVPGRKSRPIVLSQSGKIRPGISPGRVSTRRRCSCASEQTISISTTRAPARSPASRQAFRVSIHLTESAMIVSPRRPDVRADFGLTPMQQSSCLWR